MNLFRTPLLILGCSLPLSSFATQPPPTAAELWKLIQKQQSQIEQQTQQIEVQNQAIKDMKAHFSTQEKPSLSHAPKPVNHATEKPETIAANSVKEEKPYSFGGYAVGNYFSYDWDTHPDKRDETDLERFVFEGKYQFDEHWSVHAEVEYEHGGVGSTLEFDVFEEFGEFEQEIEKGGEIVLEELFVQYDYQPWLGIRVGEIPVPVGLINKRHKPSQYYTTERSAGESSMIPVAWHELGIELRGKYNGFFYRGQVITGLDSTGFSSANWIKRGFQKRFERKNAENLAFVASLDYDFAHLGIDSLKGMDIGGSFYWGNTADNRPKPDLHDDANVMILGLNGSYERGPWTLRGSALYGQLSNADLVSKANRRLSNNLNVKRTPVAKSALAWSMEAGVDLLHFVPNKSDFFAQQHFDWFVRYDNYDTMHEVSGLVFDNPRWEREVWTTGFNYSPVKLFTIKGQYSHRNINIPTENIESTFSVGVAAEF
ncbi:MAG: hypothetical protein KAG19_01975 [Methylococcales bacterium]|nr:hypothetical protein [Methylococcales bacterium]